MKAIFCLMILALIASRTRAQTNLTELLQQGMFEEQANHNLKAAIADYEALSTQFDKDRQLAATAIFRLGECYREEGLTNQAAAQYGRILSEFPDQKTLATLSQEDLAGMGAAASAATEISQNLAAPTTSGNASTEAALLASQISGVESLKSDPEEEARATVAIFPAETSKLAEMVVQLPKLREQEAWVKANPKATYYQMFQARGVVRAVGAEYPNLAAALAAANPTNALAFSSDELNKQISALEREVNFVLQIQKARLKALQAAAGTQDTSEIAQARTPAGEEDQEIARIQQMIQNSPDLINAPDDHGHTPLEKAAMDGSLKVAAYLLDHGADVNAGKFSALNLAANAGNRAMVEYLLSRGADINAKAWTGETPLHTAASEGYKAVTEALLANKADFDAQDDSGATPLLEAARNGHGQTVEVLLNAGANPNIADKDGRTPLSFAAGSGSAETVKALLAAKADPNAGTVDAPLLCAIDKEDLASAELLLQAGADPNVDGLMHCPQGSYGSQWYGEYSAALRKAPALWLAIQENQLPMIELLLKYKANPDNLQISEPPAVIFWALWNTNILQALLDSGANPNVKNDNGETPLRIVEDVATGNVNFGHNIPPDQQMKIAASAADLLRQHGALEVLPDWDRINVTRPSKKYSRAVIYKGTNSWNQFTLMELLSKVDYAGPFPSFPFPDFARITVVRPNATGEISKRIPVNLLNTTNGVDCSRDVPLEFGDVVEIPEREHTLGENDKQTEKITREIMWCLKNNAGTAKLIVDGGQTIQLPLKDSEPVTCYLGDILADPFSRNVLTSDSDLSRVNVTRRDPKTGKLETWTVDRSTHNWACDPNDLWVRDGDVIEVPER